MFLCCPIHNAGETTTHGSWGRGSSPCKCIVWTNDFSWFFLRVQSWQQYRWISNCMVDGGIILSPSLPLSLSLPLFVAAKTLITMIVTARHAYDCRLCRKMETAVRTRCVRRCIGGAQRYWLNDDLTLHMKLTPLRFWCQYTFGIRWIMDVPINYQQHHHQSWCRWYPNSAGERSEATAPG